MSSDHTFASSCPEVIVPDVPICCYLFGQLEKNLQAFGDNIYMEDRVTGSRVLYSEVVPKVKNIMYTLKEAGFKKGSTLFFAVHNTVDLPLVHMAVWCCEGVIGGRLPTFPLDAMEEFVRTMGATFILCDQESAPKLLQVVSTDVPLTFLAFTPMTGCVPIYSDNPAAQNIGIHQACEQKDLNSPVLIGFSSGTTGKFKAVMHTHRTVATYIEAPRQYGLTDTGSSTAGKRLLSLCYMGHLSGVFSTFVVFASHQHCVIVPRFDSSTSAQLRILSETKPCYVFTIPSCIHMMVKHPNLKVYELESLEGMFVAGTKLDPDLCAHVFEILPNLRCVDEVYAMSETCFIATRTYTAEFNFTSKRGSCGKLVPSCALKIVDLESSRSLPAGNIGEICVRTATMMKGYVDNPEATQGFFKDGWAHTGDVGYIDEDGFLFVTGRAKELIKYNYLQVSPADIEAYLLSHAQVLAAMVVGKPDRIYGELPTAFVVLRSGSKITEGEICNYVNDRVADHWKLRGGVRFIESIPHNANWKPMRATLRKLLEVASDSDGEQ